MKENIIISRVELNEPIELGFGLNFLNSLVLGKLELFAVRCEMLRPNLLVSKMLVGGERFKGL